MVQCSERRYATVTGRHGGLRVRPSAPWVAARGRERGIIVGERWFRAVAAWFGVVSAGSPRIASACFAERRFSGAGRFYGLAMTPLRALGLVVVASVALFAGCAGEELPPGMDRAAEDACDRFAAYVKDGQPRASRAEVVEEVVGSARRSTSGRVADMAEPLARVGAAGTDGAWGLAADGFAQACFDAGWKG